MQHVVIDDLRSFPFEAAYARSSREGIELLAAMHENGQAIDELWLDHDLGGDDTIVPIVDWLCERCVWDDRPEIGTIVVHTSNPAGAQMIERTLRRWYPTVRIDAHTAGATVPSSNI